jgi:hypothetical protein
MMQLKKQSEQLERQKQALLRLECQIASGLPADDTISEITVIHQNNINRPEQIEEA